MPIRPLDHSRGPAGDQAVQAPHCGPAHLSLFDLDEGMRHPVSLTDTSYGPGSLRLLEVRHRARDDSQYPEDPDDEPGGVQLATSRREPPGPAIACRLLGAPGRGCAHLGSVGVRQGVCLRRLGGGREGCCNPTWEALSQQAGIRRILDPGSALHDAVLRHMRYVP
jgi:hypothetical protein